jgi:hypothetical protein
MKHMLHLKKPSYFNPENVWLLSCELIRDFSWELHVSPRK